MLRKVKNKVKDAIVNDVLDGYVGPYISDGDIQTSVLRGTHKPKTKLGALARDHDSAYNTSDYPPFREMADQKFVDEARKLKGPLAKLSAFLVSSNLNSLRGNTRSKIDMAKNKNKNKSKSTPVQQNKNKNKNKNNKLQQPKLKVDLAPATIGTSMSSFPTTTRSVPGGVAIRGRELITTVNETNSSAWFLGALIPVNPIYWYGTNVSNLTRSFNSYRINSLTVHFVTRQPTSSTGEIILCHQPDLAEPSYNSSASSFLPIVMSTTSVMGPVWVNHSMKIKPSKLMKLNALAEIDINDNIHGEISAFVQSAVTDVVGYILFDYDISFVEPRYTLHSTSIPVTTGVGLYSSGVYADTVNEVSGSPLAINTPFAYAEGAIFRVVFNATNTSFAAGTTAATSLQITSSNSSSTGLTSITVVNGLTLYAFQSSGATNMTFYPSLALAASNSSKDYGSMVTYQTTVAAKTTWAFTAYIVQSSPAILVTTQ